MENNANRHRFGIVLFLLLFFSSFLVSGQTQSNPRESQSQGSLYSHYNVIFGVNTSRILNIADSLPNLGYGYGIGGGLEKEIFINQKVSSQGSMNVNLLHSRTSNGASRFRVLAGNIRLTGKYYLSHRVAIYGGFSGYYTVLQQLKSSSIDESWASEKWMNEYQIGGLAGLDFYLFDWSSLRTFVSIHQQSVSFEVAIVLTPDYLE